MHSAFRNGDLVQIDTRDVSALARVRENSRGRLHVALEVGEYLPWVDEPVVIRTVGGQDAQGAPVSHRARVLHAGNSSALLELIADEVERIADQVVPLSDRELPSTALLAIDENW